MSIHTGNNVEARSKSPINFRTIIEQLINQHTIAINFSELISGALQNTQNKDALIATMQCSVNPIFLWLGDQLAEPEVEHSVNQQIIQLLQTGHL